MYAKKVCIFKDILIWNSPVGGWAKPRITSEQLVPLTRFELSTSPIVSMSTCSVLGLTLHHGAIKVTGKDSGLSLTLMRDEGHSSVWSLLFALSSRSHSGGVLEHNAQWPCCSAHSPSLTDFLILRYTKLCHCFIIISNYLHTFLTLFITQQIHRV
jgi:hypothetical protein